MTQYLYKLSLYCILINMNLTEKVEGDDGVINLKQPDIPKMTSPLTGNAVYLCQLIGKDIVGHVAVRLLRGIDDPESAKREMDDIMLNHFNEPGRYVVAGSHAVSKYYGIPEYTPRQQIRGKKMPTKVLSTPLWSHDDVNIKPEESPRLILAVPLEGLFG